MSEMTPGPDDELDRLLAEPGHGDEALAALLRTARTRLATPPSEAARQRHLAAVHDAARERAGHGSLSWARRIRTVVGMTGVKVGLAAAAAAAVTGGAATGTLPPPVQDVVADVGEAVGIDVPRPGAAPEAVPPVEGRRDGGESGERGGDRGAADRPGGPPADVPDRGGAAPDGDGEDGDGEDGQPGRSDEQRPGPPEAPGEQPPDRSGQPGAADDRPGHGPPVDPGSAPAGRPGGVAEERRSDRVPDRADAGGRSTGR